MNFQKQRDIIRKRLEKIKLKEDRKLYGANVLKLEAVKPELKTYDVVMAWNDDRENAVEAIYLFEADGEHFIVDPDRRNECLFEDKMKFAVTSCDHVERVEKIKMSVREIEKALFLQKDTLEVLFKDEK